MNFWVDGVLRYQDTYVMPVWYFTVLSLLKVPHCGLSSKGWIPWPFFHEYEMFTIDVHYYVVTTTVSYSSSLYKWTQYPRLESVLCLLHLYQHHFPWLRSDKSGIDILRGPPHPVWLCTSGVLLPEYPHYCWCCMNTSGWTLPALIYTVCIEYKVTDVKI